MRTASNRNVNGLATRPKAELGHVPLHDVVTQLPGLLCVTRGPEHAIHTVNRLFLDSIGGRSVVGLTIREAFPKGSSERLEAMDRAYATGGPVSFKDVTDAASTDTRGESRFFNLVVQPLKDGAGQVYGLVTLGVDVTEEQKTKQELAELALALERTNRELDSFAYAASHDLRAPLRGIANLAQWIEEDLVATGPLKSETREMLELMRIRMHRMEGLIEGLLQYSRAGRSHQDPEMVDVNELIDDVVDLLAPPEDTMISIASELPTIRTERLLLQQVFMNLIGNALKHCGRRDCEITIDAKRVGPFYEFSVRDNGPGIPPDYQERIWGIFQTLESRDHVEGAGIGLALVKKIVETQKGRAWVESALGAGATFRFLWRKG